MKKTTGVILFLSFAALYGCSLSPGTTHPANTPEDYALSCKQLQDEVFYTDDLIRQIEGNETLDTGFWGSIPFAEEKLRDLRARKGVLLGIYTQKGCGNQ